MCGWIGSLANAGVDVSSVESGQIILCHDGQSRTFKIHKRSRPPRVGELSAPVTTSAILVAPSLTASSEATLRRLGWSWATDDGHLHLRFGEHTVDAAGPMMAARVEPPATGLGARGIGTFAVLRRLLLQPRWRQVHLGAASGVTQARVSQVLNTLTKAGLIARDIDGWGVTDWDRALAVWLSSYPGPRGVTTYWSGLDDVWANTLRALDGLPYDAVVSGDVAADLVAPWRQPQSATIYVSAMTSLVKTGLVPAAARDDGTVAVCVPDDHSVWPIKTIDRTFHEQSIRIADPLQVLIDVKAADDAESAAAAERLTIWIRREHDGGAAHG
jgi:hypothetical protein